MNKGEEKMEVVAALEHDAQLMLRVREGDDAAFAPLLERYRRPVVHFLYRMVLNRAVAEELAQEVFLRVYRSRETYVPSAKFTTWLYRISTHVALNWLRDKKKERDHKSIEAAPEQGREFQLEDESPTTEQEMLKQARLQEVREAIHALPEKQRAAVLMHKYDELEYSQIAKSLGCSEAALKSLLFRAYETLRGRLAHLV